MTAIDFSGLDEIIQNHKDPEVFSGVCHVSKAGEVLFAQSYGYAIRTEAVANQVHTRFQTASGSKIFTGAAVCKLIEQGKLGFETKLIDCVEPEFPNFDPGVTVGHLLTHQSGITSYFEEDVDPDYEALWLDYPMYRVREPKDFLPLFQHKGMKFPPGARFEYNDGGFILLGLIAESVTGKAFPEIIQELVFNPAGMEGSGYFPTNQLPGNTAYAYIQNPDGHWRTNFFSVPILGAPDGGAFTTAPDMASFWRSLLGHHLLSPEMTAALCSPQSSTGWNPPYTHYGYGVWLEQTAGKTQKVFVEGSDPGVALRSAYFPTQDLVLTLIGNTADALWPLYDQIEPVVKNWA